LQQRQDNSSDGIVVALKNRQQQRQQRVHKILDRRSSSSSSPPKTSDDKNEDEATTNTTIVLNAKKGDKKIFVASIQGLEEDMDVSIGKTDKSIIVNIDDDDDDEKRGGGNVAVGINLETPLKYDHKAGTRVVAKRRNPNSSSSVAEEKIEAPTQDLEIEPKPTPLGQPQQPVIIPSPLNDVAKPTTPLVQPQQPVINPSPPNVANVEHFKEMLDDMLQRLNDPSHPKITTMTRELEMLTQQIEELRLANTKHSSTNNPFSQQVSDKLKPLVQEANHMTKRIIDYANSDAHNPQFFQETNFWANVADANRKLHENEKHFRDYVKDLNSAVQDVDHLRILFQNRRNILHKFITTIMVQHAKRAKQNPTATASLSATPASAPRQTRPTAPR
jgi:hypothetical protein